MYQIPFIMKNIIILVASFIMLSSQVKSQSNTITEVKIITSAQCDMCKKRIEDGLYTQKGVIEATLDVPTKILTIKFRSNKTDADKLRNYVSSLGYSADSIPANKEAYDQLPGCCQIDGMK